MRRAARPVHPPGRRADLLVPLPGLGVQLIDDLGIDPGQTLVVGTSTAEKTFANRLGCNYVSAAEFLG